MKISSTLLDEVIAHAVADAPNECCGVIAISSASGISEARSIHRARNAAASPLRFEIDPREALGLVGSIEERGLDLGAIYHSHTRTAPYPSQTDINFAASWPGVEWVIVGLAAENAEPEVRSYLIEGAQVTEVPLQIEPR